MDKQRIQELKKELDNDNLSYGDIVDIENAFAEIPDEQLRDLRENAMASDMLDELEAQNKSNLVGGKHIRVTGKDGIEYLTTPKEVK